MALRRAAECCRATTNSTTAATNLYRSARWARSYRDTACGVVSNERDSGMCESCSLRDWDGATPSRIRVHRVSLWVGFLLTRNRSASASDESTEQRRADKHSDQCRTIDAVGRIQQAVRQSDNSWAEGSSTAATVRCRRLRTVRRCHKIRLFLNSWDNSDHWQNRTNFRWTMIVCCCYLEKKRRRRGRREKKSLRNKNRIENTRMERSVARPVKTEKSRSENPFHPIFRTFNVVNEHKKPIESNKLSYNYGNKKKICLRKK